MAQKRKARASASMPIRVKFVGPKLREVSIKVDFSMAAKATSKTATNAPSL